MSTEQQHPAKTPRRPLSEPELVAALEASRERTPAPPVGLLERLRADIPQELPAVNEHADPESNRRGRPGFLGFLLPRSTHWMWGSPALGVAAALVLLVGAGILTYGVRQQRQETSAMADTAEVSESPTNALLPSRAPSPEAPAETSVASESEPDAKRQISEQGLARRSDLAVGQAEAGSRNSAAQPGLESQVGALAAVRDDAARAKSDQDGERWWEVLAGDEDRSASPAGAGRPQAAPAPPPTPRPEPAQRPSAAAGRDAVATRPAAPAAQASEREADEFAKEVEAHNRDIDELAAEQQKLKDKLEPLPKPDDSRSVQARRADAPVAARRAEPPSRVAGLQKRTAETITVTSEAPVVVDGDAEATEADDVARRRLSGPPADRPAEPPTPPRPSFDGMFFRDYGSHPFVDASADPLSTFGLDVDTGSYTIGRRYLELGQLPPPASVRVEEWVNFFDYGDPAPRRGDFALAVEGARLPEDPTDRGASYLVRVGVKARELRTAERRSAVLVLLVDTSGSMSRENRLGLVRQSLSMLLDELRDDDEVALVTYGSRARVLLPPTRDKLSVRRALDGLQAQGSTNLEHGMALAYELLARNHRPEALHRVVLCSDGVANVGLTDPEALLRSVAEHAARGIELLAVGVGMGNYNDELLERLADRGDGAYAYVDSLQEARRVFVDELTGTLESVAGDARAQVAFDPQVVTSYRLVGYANRDLPDAAFRDPRTDAGEIGSGHRVSALYEVSLRADAPRTAPLGRVTLRWRSRANGNFEETSVALDRSRLAPSFERAAPSFRLAATVAELAEVLRAFDPDAGQSSAGAPHLDRMLARARSLSVEIPGRADVEELVRLIGRARDVAAERE